MLIILILSVTGCSRMNHTGKQNALAGKVICLDPGHGGTAETDHFRVGPSGEREEWINLRVALLLRDMLEDKGATVIMTRTEDVSVGLKERAMIAVENKSDVFLSIHHNATADPAMNYPIIYFHGNASENKAGTALAECVGGRLRAILFSNREPAVIASDHVIFPGWGTAVLRHSYGIPGVIGEASFFSNPKEEQRLKQAGYNEAEAKAYVEALKEFFRKPSLPVHEKYSKVKLPEFEVFQEEERAKTEALSWRRDYEKALALMEEKKVDSLKEAYELLTRSAKAFPDSPVARECHLKRAAILEKLGKPEEAKIAEKRAKEHFIVLK